MELRVGFVGIIKLTYQIIRKNFKHFLCIAVIVALPSAMNLIVLDPSSTKLYHVIKAVAALMSTLHQLVTHLQGQFIPSPPQPQPQLYPLPLLIALLAFSMAISLISMPLLSFSVCRASLNLSLDLKGSLRGIPRSATNLALTALCEFAVLTGFVTVAMVAMAIIGAAASALKANPTTAMSIWGLGTLAAVVYLRVSFSLADAVAILEGKKGWEAMRRSMYLLAGGRKWLMALWLSCVFSAPLMLLPIAVSEEASLLWRWGAAAVSLGLQASIVLFGMCAHVLLYLSCKSCREEPLDPLNVAAAAGPQFGPLGGFPLKLADLEKAAILSPEQEKW